MCIRDSDRRLLGREGDYTPEQLQQVQNTWRNAGYNMDLDKDTGYYMLNLSLIHILLHM